MANYDVLGLRGQEPSVRLAERADANTLAAIHHRAWHNAYAAHLPESLVGAVTKEACEHAWRAEVTAGRAWVATADSLAVAAMSLNVTDTIEITALYVDPLHQRKGHASRLLNQAAQIGRDSLSSTDPADTNNESATPDQTATPDAPATSDEHGANTAGAAESPLIQAWVLAADTPRLDFFRSAGMAPVRRKRELSAPGLTEPLSELLLTAQL